METKVHNKAENLCASADFINLSHMPDMKVVKGSTNVSDSDADTSSEIADLAQDRSQLSEEATRLRSPGSPSSRDSKGVARSFRMARGVSLLPVRHSAEPVRYHEQLGSTSSPPNTSSPKSSRHVDFSKSPSGRLESGNLSFATNVPPGEASTASNSSDTLADGATASSSYGNTNILPPQIENDQLLGTYIRQLASKEAQVGDLRNAIANLQRDLEVAEAELADFKNNGNRLAQLVYEQRDVNSIKKSNKVLPGSEGQKDVLGMGRRVVDEINSQFWSFLDDVKSATMGNADFEVERSRQGKFSEYRRRSPSRSPSPRRKLNPKKSIQDFIRARSGSPIREVLSTNRSNSPSRLERKEIQDSQRIRESERLSRKLSHIDLRAPSSPKLTTPVETSTDNSMQDKVWKFLTLLESLDCCHMKNINAACLSKMRSKSAGKVNKKASSKRTGIRSQRLKDEKSMLLLDSAIEESRKEIQFQTTQQNSLPKKQCEPEIWHNALQKMSDQAQKSVMHKTLAGPTSKSRNKNTSVMKGILTGFDGINLSGIDDPKENSNSLPRTPHCPEATDEIEI